MLSTLKNAFRHISCPKKKNLFLKKLYKIDLMFLVEEKLFLSIVGIHSGKRWSCKFNQTFHNAVLLHIQNTMLFET